VGCQNLTLNSVRRYVQDILEKLAGRSKLEAVAAASRHLPVA